VKGGVKCGSLVHICCFGVLWMRIYERRCVDLQLYRFASPLICIHLICGNPVVPTGQMAVIELGSPLLMPLGRT